MESKTEDNEDALESITVLNKHETQSSFSTSRHVDTEESKLNHHQTDDKNDATSKLSLRERLRAKRYKTIKSPSEDGKFSDMKMSAIPNDSQKNNFKVDTTKSSVHHLLLESPTPEIYFIGEIVGGSSPLCKASSDDSISCIFSLRHGQYWSRLNGSTSDNEQTQHAYCGNDGLAVWNHPLQVSYVSTSVQGWPQIVVQLWKADAYGRESLIGYGFTHLPSHPGESIMKICCWRPVGTDIIQEMKGAFLGLYPSFANNDAVFATAWEDRNDFVTVASGEIFLSITTINRFWKECNMKDLI